MASKHFKAEYHDIIDQLSKDLDISLIGKYLHCMTDGRVYAYGYNKIFKISNKWSSDKYKNKLLKILKNVQEKRPSFIVKIYNYGECGNRIWYIMEKLEPLSCSDADIINVLGDYYENYLSLSEQDEDSFREILLEVEDNYEYNIKLKHKIFFYNVFTYKHHYWDFHSGNIMKNSKDKLKLIDLESFVISYELDRDDVFKDY